MKYTKTCVECGKTFETKYKCQILCFRKLCKVLHKRIKQNKYEINCKQCNKLFKTNKKNQIFCSEDCGRLFRNNKYQDKIKELKPGFQIFNRDNFKCIYCGKSSIEDGVKLHIDHIRPKSCGGKNNMSNYVTACEKCNIHKSNLFDEELIERVLKIVKERNKKCSTIDKNDTFLILKQ